MTEQTPGATGATTAGAAAGTTTTQAKPLKFKMRVAIGFDNGPKFGVSTKSAVYELEGTGMQDIMTKALQKYVDEFGQEPSGFASFQLTLALDTGVKKGEAAKA